jgi:ubiquinone/menaquinone biosynthesis C-methylase UbiE
MNHADHVDLLRDGVPSPGGTWADLGCGSGAFTLALAELVGPRAEVYAIDRDQRALAQLRTRARSRFAHHDIRTIEADFTQRLDLPRLDGIVMANSLHFVKDKEPVVLAARALLAPTARFILVEYNTDRGNRWVPHPMSYPTWERLAYRCGFSSTLKIGAKPSSFLGEIYSAISWNGQAG